MFGNFNYTLGSGDKISVTMNDDPAYSQIANRTGLPASFANVGQGYGYAGHLSAAQAAMEGIGTQQQDGQDINQRDLNQFAVLNWQHTVNPTTTSNVSVGYTRSELDLTNNNPAVNLNNLPADNSIEFNPTLTRDSSHAQAQGSVTNTAGAHTFKLGALYDDQSGKESYQFIPASQLALNALAALDPGNAQLLAPAGTFTGATDVLGNRSIISPAPASRSDAERHAFGVLRGGVRAGYLEYHQQTHGELWAKIRRVSSAGEFFEFQRYEFHFRRLSRRALPAYESGL